MNTPSHFLMSAALDRALPRVPIVKSAFLVGSVAPDVPLWLLSLGGVLYYHVFLDWSPTQTANLMFDQLYFEHPVWIALHNLLHSPTLLLMGLALLWKKRRHIMSPWRWGFWFLVSCLLHSTVDILTHVDDGPLLFFPFEWTIRFRSAISYWDDQYYGREVGRIELLLDLFFMVYLLWVPGRRWVHRLRRRSPLDV